MPTLNWIGKDKVINHHQDVPYKILEPQYGFTDGVQQPETNNSGNKIIHGDNLEALKSLLPEYEGKIKCIYIDPPYNTGEEKWIYNDNVNHPRLKKWLGEVVGKDNDDLTRHDKWLCMMYPRLKLLHKLLHPEGVMFISIDDHENSSLKLICDEIFGQNKFIATNVWQKRYSRENREAIGDVHEYIYVYSKNPKAFKEYRNLIPANEKQLKVYRNPNNDPKGRWRTIPMTAQAGHATKEQFYPVTTPTGVIHYPSEGRCWGIAETTYKKLLDEGRIYFGLTGDSQPNTIRYLSEVEGLVPWTWWNHEEVGNTDEAKKEIYNILGKQVEFGTPKPVRLIERILRIATKPGDIVLDSFAGTATTAHAVLNLNLEDNGDRKFIIIEMEDYCDEITSKRVKNAITGYSYSGSTKETLYSKKLNIQSIKNGNLIFDEVESLKEKYKGEFDEVKTAIENNSINLYGINKTNVSIEPTGGNFNYYKLGEPLFLEEDILNEKVGIENILKYIWYSETRTPFTKIPDLAEANYRIGSKDNTDYYFYYLNDGQTTVDYDFMAKIKRKASQYIIYADNCLIEKDFMLKHHVIFKKIPRDITRF
jgi:adenine-specific DNA-methyltransferase